MSRNFSQFDKAMEEFRRGNMEDLSDHGTRTISAQSEIDVVEPSSKGMLENCRIIRALNTYALNSFR